MDGLLITGEVAMTQKGYYGSKSGKVQWMGGELYF